MTSVKSALDRLYDTFFPSKSSKRVLVLGLDAVGKTTILYRLKLGEVITTIPTIGFNVEEIRLPTTHGKLHVTAWDVGGCDKIRPLWRHYFQNLSGAIFMIDSNDRERLSESINEFKMLQRELQHSNSESNSSKDKTVVPMLIFANKQDLPGSMPAEEIASRFLDNQVPNPAHWKVFPLSAIAPNNELSAYVQPAFDWLYDALNNSKTQQANDKPNAKPSAEVKEKPQAIDSNAGPRSPLILRQKFESWISRLDSDKISPSDFLSMFHSYSLPSWDHYTHIRLAFIILTTFGRQKGKNMIFDGIESYIANSQQTTGKTFHLTMTYFWIQMVHYGIRQTPPPTRDGKSELTGDDFGLFLLVNPYVVDGNLWEDYYSREVIMTPNAKEGMVLPDKKPLPNIVGREIVQSKLKLEEPFQG